MDSMPVRDKGFELVLKRYPADQVEQLMIYHRKNGGLSRYVKFRHFFEVIRNETITEEAVKSLASEFSIVMRKELTNKALLIEDSMSFVMRSYSRHPMHIVSGSDGRELNYLCEELNIAHYFQSIQGSPTPKKELVKNVLIDNDPKDCVLIGDSGNDYEAAIANNIAFYGYNNVALKSISDNYITSFKNL
jgi:phosphoglycolate phosphatase-like HAD superfamily hydrolase